MGGYDLRELLERNKEYIRTKFSTEMAESKAAPKANLAVVSCMDARHSVNRVLGLGQGDAIVIRNAGAIIDDGCLRSVLVAIHKLGVNEVIVMGHSDCGMRTLGRGDFVVAKSIHKRTGVSLNDVMRPDFQRWLGGFYGNVEENVRHNVELLRSHPFIPNDVVIQGLIYDNQTGEVRPI